MPPAPSPHPPRALPWYLAGALLAVVAGFWPTFFRPGAPLDAAHALHGATATLWMLALVGQAWLMTRGHARAHRLVARAALPLFVLMWGTALHMMRVMAGAMAAPWPFLAQLLWVDAATLPLLAALVAVALWRVRVPGVHWRCMALTALLPLPPALTRLYARLAAPALDFVGALHASFVTVDLVLVALLLRARGTPRTPYAVVLAVLVLTQATLGVARSAGWWRAAMAALALPPG